MSFSIFHSSSNFSRVKKVSSFQLDPWSALAQHVMRKVFCNSHDDQQAFIQYLKDIKLDAGDGFHGQLARGTVSFATYLRALWWTGNLLPEAWKDAPFTDTWTDFIQDIHEEIRVRNAETGLAFKYEDPIVSQGDFWESRCEVRSRTHRPNTDEFYEAWAARVMRYEIEVDDDSEDEY